MTAAEIEIYERARLMWLELSRRHRNGSLAPTFGLQVETHQLFGARLLAWLRALWRTLP